MCHNGELELECYKPQKKTFQDVLAEYNNAYQEKEANTSLIPCTLEGCVVRISDIISYLGRDIEDALRLHTITKDALPKDIMEVTGYTNKEIVNYFINDIITNSYGKDYIKMSSAAFQNLKKLKKFNYEHIYSQANSKDTLEKWQQMMEKLFNSALKDLQEEKETSDIYIYFYKYMNADYKKNTSKERVVIDYISGMTDRFFLTSYEKLDK